MQSQVGLLAVKCGDDRRHQVRSQSGRHTKPEGADEVVSGAPREVADVLDLDDHPACARGDLSPHRRQLDARVAPVDQDDVKPLFQRAKLLAERWLRNMAGVRCPSEMFNVRDGHQIFQLAKCRHLKTP